MCFSAVNISYFTNLMCVCVEVAYIVRDTNVINEHPMNKSFIILYYIFHSRECVLYFFPVVNRVHGRDWTDSMGTFLGSNGVIDD